MYQPQYRQTQSENSLSLAKFDHALKQWQFGKEQQRQQQQLEEQRKEQQFQLWGRQSRLKIREEGSLRQVAKKDRLKSESSNLSSYNVT